MPGDPLGILKSKSSSPTEDPLGILKKKDQEEALRPQSPFSLNDALNYGKGLMSLDFLPKSSASISQSPSQSKLDQTENPYREIVNNKKTALNSYENGQAFLTRDFDERRNILSSNRITNGSHNEFAPESIKAEEAAFSNKLPSIEASGSVLADPDLLRNYRVERSKEIDSTIEELDRQKKQFEGIASRDEFGVRDVNADILKNSPEYIELNAQIAQQKKYKMDLIKSVANVASIDVPKKFINSNQPVKNEDVGKEYLKVIGDAQIADDERVLSDIERGLADSETVHVDSNGKIVPTNKKDIERTQQGINYRLYKTGAEVMSNYFGDLSDKKYDVVKPKFEQLANLFDNQDSSQNPTEKIAYQSQINRLLEDKDIQDYLGTVRTSLDYFTQSQNAANQFPQVKRAELRQKLNDAFFELNKLKDASKGGVTSLLTPSVFNPTVYHAIFGATPSESDIPFLANAIGVSKEEARSIMNERVKGFIGESPSGIRVNGILQGIAQGADETLAKALMGIRRFADSEDAETANRLLNTRLEGYNLTAQKNKLRDDLGNYNINPNSIFNTMGKGIGQTAIYAAPTVLTGGLAAEGTIAQKILEGATTIGTGYVGSYEDAYKEAAKYTDDEKLRRSYANVTAFENALPELFMSPADIVKKIGIGKVGSKAAFEAFAKETGEIGLEKTVAQRFGTAVKEFANVVGAENLEELATLASNTLTKKSQLGIETSFSEFLDQAMETAITTTITTLPLGVGAGIGKFNDVSGIRKEALFEIGNEPDLYKVKLKELFDKKQITEEQYNAKVATVNTMSQIVSSVNKAKKSNGKGLSYDEKKELAALQFRIQQNEKLKSEGAIAADEQRIDEDNQEAVKAQSEILNDETEDENRFTEDDEYRLHELENRGNQVVDVNTLESIRENAPRNADEEQEYQGLVKKQSNVKVTYPKSTGQTTTEGNVTVTEPTVRPSENVSVQMPSQIKRPEKIQLSGQAAQSLDETSEIGASQVQEASMEESLPDFNTSVRVFEDLDTDNEINYDKPIIEKARRINNNFDAIVKQLMDSNIIKREGC